MLTASTLHKEKLFNTPEKLDYLERELLGLNSQIGLEIASLGSLRKSLPFRWSGTK